MTNGGAPSNPATAPSTAAAVAAVRALARASRLLERVSEEANLSHYRVLSAIAAGDERASRIASKLALGKPAISATVDALCQRGLLSRSAVQGDQRAAALRLSPDGEEVLASMEAAMTEWVGQVCALVPDGDRLIESLVWMGDAIDRMAAEHHGRR